MERSAMRQSCPQIAALRASIRATGLIGAAVVFGAIPAMAQQQSFDGAYKRAWECPGASAAPQIVRMPLVVLVHNGRALASVPTLDIEGTEAVDLSAVVASGSVAADGSLQLSVIVYGYDAIIRADYAGTLDAARGKLIGTQVWTQATNGKTVTRSCSGSFVKIDLRAR
jgi:hypothetical protein